MLMSLSLEPYKSDDSCFYRISRPVAGRVKGGFMDKHDAKFRYYATQRNKSTTMLVRALKSRRTIWITI